MWFTILINIHAVFGSIAKPIDEAHRPPNISPEHTHTWTVFVRGVEGEDISYWLKKVQFKLHETYSQSIRTIEAPDAFEVTETGWGEFEVMIKLYFVPEANEKSQTLWHALKLHPYGPDAEKQKENKEPIVSQNYEEIVFNEPVEQFYDILTSGPVPVRGKGGSKGSKQAAFKKQSERSAEIPHADSADNPYSRETEGKELDRISEARKQVDQMIKEEREKVTKRESVLEELRKSVGPVPKGK